jgi:hypothetical protein
MLRWSALFVACSLSVLSAAPASAQLILAEDFSYSDGPLAGANGGLNWSTAWNLSAGGTGTLNVQGGEVLAGLPTADGRNALRFTTANGWAGDATALWFSMRVTNQGAEFASVGLRPDFAVVTIGMANGFFNVNGNATPLAAVDGVEYLLVGRLTRNDAGNDTLDMWVNPTSAGDPILGSSSGSFLPGGHTAISTVLFGANNSAGPAASARFDDLLVGSTFADVVPTAIPEPGSMALCGLGLAGFVAWRRRAR